MSSNHDVVIVGSGFGGSVTACRLAEAGLRVLVLERGPWWASSPDDGPGEAARTRRHPHGVRGVVRSLSVSRARVAYEAVVDPAGLFEVNTFTGLTTFTASGVGGGSHTYTAAQAQPDHEQLAQALPAGVAGELLDAFDRVRAMIRPAALPPGGPPVAVERAARNAGLATERPTLALRAGVEPRTEIFGSPSQDKPTLDRTYLAEAIRHGAEVRALCEVRRIGVRDGSYEVHVYDHVTRRAAVVGAPRLVLAAGTLGTLRLLFAARDRDRALPGVSSRLGVGFTPNGDVVRVLLGARDGADHGRQTPFGAMVPRRVGGAHSHVMGEIGLPVEQLGLRSIAPWMRRISLLVGMGRDGTGNGMSLRYGRLVADVRRDRDASLYECLDQELRMLAQGYEAWSMPLSRRHLTSVHPLGGAAMADDPALGVVDRLGAVHGHPGLFVADGSTLPAAPGLPPSMTISAMAERQAAAMLHNHERDTVAREHAT